MKISLNKEFEKKNCDHLKRITSGIGYKFEYCPTCDKNVLIVNDNFGKAFKIEYKEVTIKEGKILVKDLDNYVFTLTFDSLIKIRIDDILHSQHGYKNYVRKFNLEDCEVCENGINPSNNHYPYCGLCYNTKDRLGQHFTWCGKCPLDCEDFK